jgi:hypothetical protein
MIVFFFLLLTLLQLITGHGLITIFRLRLLPLMHFALSLLCGIAIHSFIPFLLELLTIPLTSLSIFSGILLAGIVFNFRFRQSMLLMKEQVSNLSFRFRIYKLPYLLVVGCLVLISIWRCYYLPPTPRDLTSGAEVIAEYAVREKSMINSVFNVNLETTNNPFKPPFVTALQIIYKYAGFEFGQVWLSTIFVAFLLFIYSAIRMTLHPLIAGWLLVVFLAIPEMYAYTFMVLFDYSNAVFFFLSCWFLIAFFKEETLELMTFSAFLMAVATYIRSETLLLAGFVCLALLVYAIRKHFHLSKILLLCASFMLPCMVVYLFSVTIYLNYYLPIPYPVADLVNTDFTNLEPLFRRFTDMNGQLLFSSLGLSYYGYFIYLFLLLAIADLLYAKRLSAAGRNWLFAILVIYLGLPVIGYLLPLMDLFNTTKRALFKLFPLLLLYLANTRLLMEISGKIDAWELAEPVVAKKHSA